jgi:fermentation-respiration switch protein FrsA (DUF1100 family)
MSDLWLGVTVLFSVPLLVILIVGGLYLYVRWKFLGNFLRIFQERPLFIIPRGEPRAGAEEVHFKTRDGLTLRGCYLKTGHSRRGVILFGLEFGSNRWSCQPYCESLLDSGYDIFAFEPRNQGDSEQMANYHPLQWLTSYELVDTQAAIAYLKGRPDADSRGIGFFGISKGANAGLMAAARDRYVRCLVTDGAFGTYTTMIPYMRKWVAVYNENHLTHGLLPGWFYGAVAMAGVRRIQRERHVRFLHLERAMTKLRRPLLMIHGGGDTYIKVEMAREIFKRATGPKDFWLVPGAKHNQALYAASDEYSRRVVDFFAEHLSDVNEPIDSSYGDAASREVSPASARNGVAGAASRIGTPDAARNTAPEPAAEIEPAAEAVNA